MIPGHLVVYAKDVRHVGVSNLYVVLTQPRGKKIKIHSICTMGGTANTSAPKTRKPMMVAVSDLTPISAWGMTVENITRTTLANGVEIHRINLKRPYLTNNDPALRKWGRASGATWDWMLSGEIRQTVHADLITKRMIADYLGQDAEAA